MRDALPTARRRARAAGGFAATALLAALGVLALAGLGGWVLHAWLFPGRFEPVQLSPGEARVLDAKLRRIGVGPGLAPEPDVAAPVREPHEPEPVREPLEPEPYREDPASRELSISERELNALLAHNTNLADRLAIDLSDDLASAKLLVPVDPEVPVLGGRTLRVHAGVELRVAGSRPVVSLRGISLMGVPLPNAWLGSLKDVDLVERYGGRDGFWSAFAAGIEHVQVREGELRVVLAE